MLSQSDRKADQLSTTCHAKAVAKADQLSKLLVHDLDLLIDYLPDKGGR